MTTVGIVGTGFMARTHLQQYTELGVDVAAVSSRSDPTPFIDHHGLDSTPYTSVERLCESTPVDFLDICTPTDTHRDLVEVAAAHGIDVFLEKPIAGTLRDAEAIGQFVDRTGISLMVGHVLRFDPGYERIRSTVDAGGIGAPGVARARRLSPFPDWGSRNWFADTDRSGGVFLDLAIHDLDFLRSLWGPVDRVFARRTRRDELEHGSVTLRFANGAVGYVEASWAQPESRELVSEIELAGDDGVVEFSTDGQQPIREFSSDSVRVESPLSEDGYKRELAHFVDCIESDTAPSVTVADATAAVRLALAATRSADRGEPVAPEEVRG
jgi:predicted dehydrogenase